MPRIRTHDTVARRVKIIKLLADEELSANEIFDHFKSRASIRTINEDLSWLLETFPKQIQRGKARGLHGNSRVVFSWKGSLPCLLSKPLTWLSEDELIALVAARGLLSNSDQSYAATSGIIDERDLLAASVNQILDRSGAQQNVVQIGKLVVTVNRFGAAPVDSEALVKCLAATATGDAIRCSYENVHGHRHEAHISPQRMVLIRGEWYCVAWADLLRMYRVSRMSHVTRCASHPAGKPASIPIHEVDGLIKGGFYATGSSDPKRRRTVVLAVSPGAWPFIAGRRWGDSQRIEQSPRDLAPGWRRLRFTTTGLDECRHWILSMGTGLKAEQPPELTKWIKAEAKAMSLVCHRKPR